MAKNIFGATPLQNPQPAKFVNEGKVKEAYADCWNGLKTIANRKQIADKLGVSINDIVLSKDFEDMSSVELDMIMPIIVYCLDNVNESLLSHIRKIAYAKHIDEGVFTWIIGAVIARKLWQKISGKVKESILKKAGIPANMLGNYSKQDIDSLPTNYRDAVTRYLQDYAKNVNESDESDLFISKYKEVADDVKQNILNIEGLADYALGLTEYDEIAKYYDKLSDKDKSTANKFVGIDESFSYQLVNESIEDFGTYLVKLSNTELYHQSIKTELQNTFGMQLQGWIDDLNITAINDWYNDLNADNKAKIVALTSYTGIDEATEINQMHLDTWEGLSDDDRKELAAITGADKYTDEFATSFDELPKEAKELIINYWKETGVVDEARYINDATAQGVDNWWQTVSMQSRKDILKAIKQETIDATLHIQSMPDAVQDALADYAFTNNYVNESLSEDGKVAYSSAGVAFPTASIKAIICWLCYNMVMSKLTEYSTAAVYEVNSDLGFEFKEASHPSIVQPCGTPDLTSIKTASMVPLKLTKGFVALLTMSTGSIELVTVINGDWTIVNDAALIQQFINSDIDKTLIYEAISTNPTLLPSIRKQVIPSFGLASAILICKRFASKNGGNAGVLNLIDTTGTQFTAMLRPSIVKNAIAAPSNNEFLSTPKQIIIHGNANYPYIKLVDSLYILIDGRWYMTNVVNEIERVMSLTFDIEQAKAQAKQSIQLTQSQINDIISTWYGQYPSATFATLRTKQCLVYANDIAKAKDDQMVSINFAQNIDIPAMLSKLMDMYTLTFIYDNVTYQMQIESPDHLDSMFVFTDNMKQLFVL